MFIFIVVFKEAFSFFTHCFLHIDEGKLLHFSKKNTAGKNADEFCFRHHNELTNNLELTMAYPKSVEFRDEGRFFTFYVFDHLCEILFGETLVEIFLRIAIVHNN